MQTSTPNTLTWLQYEAGRTYKQSINLYATVNQNERFFRGDQWNGMQSNGLPTPVFNIIKRIVLHFTNSILANPISFSYTDDSLPYTPSSVAKENLRTMLDLLNQHATFRWEKNKMNHLLRQSLQDAALSGDAIFYVYWDASLPTGQPFHGDFVTTLLDNVNFFVSDVNDTDLQRQEYIILAGREPISKLQKEAKEAGVSDSAQKAIVPDSETATQTGDLAAYENEEKSAAKATYLVKFFRNEDGFVIWEKSVKNTVIRRMETKMRLYPVAYYNWDRAKNSFHGVSPITAVIQNQKYINKSYAMFMKHMMDTAFSKVLYNKKLIPEWNNEVGQAIGVVTGGDLSQAAVTLGTGQMQENALAITENVLRNTKEVLGATDAALGEMNSNSANVILSLQEASNLPLQGIRDNLCQCVEDIANIWLEMMFEYYDENRMLPLSGETGSTTSTTVDYTTLRKELLHATVQVGETSRYSQIAALQNLDTLLQNGHITFQQYLERIPNSYIPQKQALLEEVQFLQKKGETV